MPVPSCICGCLMPYCHGHLRQGAQKFSEVCYRFGCVDWYDYSSTLENIYSDYHDETRSTGGIGVGAEYKFNRYLSLGVDLGAIFYYHNNYDVLSLSPTGFRLGAAINLLPKVKCFYIDRPKCRLYTSFSLGVAVYPGFYLAEEKISPAYQLTPIGVEFGKKVCGFVESGYGLQYTGLRAGVSYKF